MRTRTFDPMYFSFFIGKILWPYVLKEKALNKWKKAGKTIPQGFKTVES